MTELSSDVMAAIRDVPDFPSPGILFKDITPLLASPDAMAAATEQLAALDFGAVDKIAGIESRGFLFGVPLAMKLGVGFVPIRKPGKLPAATAAESYELEYGNDTVEMHADAIERGQRVAIVDDLIATGGTARAAVDLAEQAGASVEGISFLVELAELGGRAVLGDRPIHSVLSY